MPAKKLEHHAMLLRPISMSQAKGKRQCILWTPNSAHHDETNSTKLPDLPLMRMQENLGISTSRNHFDLFYRHSKALRTRTKISGFVSYPSSSKRSSSQAQYCTCA